ncbi:MAG: amidohydrolase family protein, partial [Actinomycetota bacterium]|nr:amidohydrolase family protein [Actinomycetota bacterium]
ATLEGARALRIETKTGSLTPGKWADLALVETTPDTEDPEREVLDVAANGGVAATVVGGHQIYGRIADSTG